MVKVEEIGKTDEYVYDISLDGTVVNALGCNVMSNTDGFNFSLPDEFRYTEEHPYIGKGLNRIVKKGVAYHGYWGDVMEFNDLYMRKKNGLDVDEVIPASINVSRKNYLDLLDNGKIKKVGNTLKSRKMSEYIKKFLDKACGYLLNGDGHSFLESYYNTIDDISNLRIPLRDIASKGKIKQKVEDYIKARSELTKSGGKKPTQVWYEMVIKEGMKVDLDDTIYYINVGQKVNEQDCSRVKHPFFKDDSGNVVPLTSKDKTRILKMACEKKGIPYKGLKEKEKKELLAPYIIREDEEIIINCKIIPREIVESDTEILCNDDFEYNVLKYVDQFNKRIKPLLVCFSPEIRDRILITDMADKPYFTEDECKLVSGFPMRETDQDTYEALMKPEKKEIEFWLSIGERPPFVDDCGIDWDSVVNEYLEEKKVEDSLLFKTENEKYLMLLSTVTEEERNKFIEEGEIPKRFDDVVVMDSDLHFYFKNIPNITPSTSGNVIDDFMSEFTFDLVEDDFEKELDTSKANIH